MEPRKFPSIKQSRVQTQDSERNKMGFRCTKNWKMREWNEQGGKEGRRKEEEQAAASTGRKKDEEAVATAASNLPNEHH